MGSKPNPPEKCNEMRPVCPGGPVTGIRSDAIVAPATPSSIQARSFVPLEEGFRKETSSSGARRQNVTACTAKMFSNPMEHSNVYAGVWFLALSAVCQNVQR